MNDRRPGQSGLMSGFPSLMSLPCISSSRLFFKCPVVDGAELSLCYLSYLSRDEVYEKLMKLQ